MNNQIAASDGPSGDEPWFIHKLAGLSLTLQRKDQSLLLYAIHRASQIQLTQKVMDLSENETITLAMKSVGQTIGMDGIYKIVQMHPQLLLVR